MRYRCALKLLLASALGLFFLLGLSKRKKGPPLQRILNDLLERGIPPSLPIRTNVTLRIRAVQKLLQSAVPILSPQRPYALSSFIFNASELCTLISSKRILLVGPEVTFHLHSLWLSALETAGEVGHSCPGPEFCNFHHICLPPGHNISHARYKIPPKDEYLRISGSSVLRYVLSSSLETSLNRHAPVYTTAQIDPLTSVRVKDAFWRAKARSSDIILLNRGPIPAPTATYQGRDPLGNWSFAADGPWLFGSEIPRTLETSIIHAALVATLYKFVPQVVRSLHEIYQEPMMAFKTLIWQSNWYNDFIPPNWIGNQPTKDPWALYYNSQVYMQDYLMRAILPSQGIYYLPAFMPSSMAGADRASKSVSQDGLRPPIGTRNAQMMTSVFLNGLSELLEILSNERVNH